MMDEGAKFREGEGIMQRNRENFHDTAGVVRTMLDMKQPNLQRSQSLE